MDGLIGAAVVCCVLDALPCTPPAVRQWLIPVLGRAGLWQGPWTLFAPIPDSQNHRVRVTFEFDDRPAVVWWSPDWKHQSPGERFLSHRESEFLEKITADSQRIAWHGFVRALGRDLGCDSARSIHMVVELRMIPPPGTAPSDDDVTEHVLYSWVAEDAGPGLPGSR